MVKCYIESCLKKAAVEQQLFDVISYILEEPRSLQLIIKRIAAPSVLLRVVQCLIRLLEQVVIESLFRKSDSHTDRIFRENRLVFRVLQDLVDCFYLAADDWLFVRACLFHDDSELDRKSVV